MFRRELSMKLMRYHSNHGNYYNNNNKNGDNYDYYYYHDCHNYHYNQNYNHNFTSIFIIINIQRVYASTYFYGRVLPHKNGAHYRIASTENFYFTDQF